jgi:hypothetical protein
MRNNGQRGGGSRRGGRAHAAAPVEDGVPNGDSVASVGHSSEGPRPQSVVSDHRGVGGVSWHRGTDARTPSAVNRRGSVFGGAAEGGAVSSPASSGSRGSNASPLSASSSGRRSFESSGGASRVSGASAPASAPAAGGVIERGSVFGASSAIGVSGSGAVASRHPPSLPQPVLFVPFTTTGAPTTVSGREIVVDADCYRDQVFSGGAEWT